MIMIYEECSQNARTAQVLDFTGSRKNVIRTSRNTGNFYYGKCAN